MTIPWRLLVFGLLAVRLAAAEPTSPPQYRLASDPTTHSGTLPNGVRFTTRANAEPRGRIALRLYVDAGSLNETDAQRGLAHFVEHMAFRGTRRYPKSALVDLLQRHGLAFGADVNAFTFPGYTIYQLDVPADPPERLAEAMSVLREFADGLTFESRQIDSERGVIESERRARDNWQLRAYDARLRFLFPLSLLSRRTPIGDEAVLRKAGAKQLRHFYETWYRADNIHIIAVGDLPEEKLAAAIRAEFASMPRPATPLPAPPDLGWVGNAAKLGTSLHTDADEGAVSVELCSVVAGPLGDETPATREAEMKRELVLTMLNERFSQLRRDNSQIFGSAFAFSQSYGQLYTENCLHIDTATATWQIAVNALAREWRRADELGFSAEEIAEAVRVVRRRFEYAIAAESTEGSRGIADRIVSTLVSRRVYSSWRQMAGQVEPVMAALTPEEARKVFRSLWQPGAARLFVAGNLSLTDANQQLSHAYASGLLSKLEAPPRPQVATLDYHLAEMPGGIQSRRHVADTDVHLVEFANGVRVNLKRTDFSRNLVWLRARTAWGQQSEPAALPGLGVLAGYYLNEAGVGRHLGEDLRRFLSEQNMSLGFNSEEDAFVFTGGSDTRAVGDLLTLLAAYLNDCAWRPGDVNTAKNRIASVYGELQHEANTALNAIALRVISGDDPRLSLPDPALIRRHNFDQLMAWLDPSLRNGPLEIGLVGDFEIENVIQLAARTVGALPPRQPRKSAQLLRPVVFHNQPGRWECTVDSAVPRGSVRAQWPVRGCSDITRVRMLEVLASILQERVRREIREKLGATYDSSGEVWSGTTMRDDGYLMLQLSARPADARKLSKRITALADDLARHGATEAEFEAVVQNRLAENTSRMRDNSYWLYYVLASAQQEPVRLDWPRTRETDFRQMKLTEINRLAAEFLGSAHAQLFTAVPK